jgi:magnesium transporter
MGSILDNIRDYMQPMKDQELKGLIAEITVQDLLDFWDDMSEEEELKIFSLLDLERKVDLMTSISQFKQEMLIKSLTSESAKLLLAEMDPDDLTDFIQAVTPEVRQSVWDSLDEEAKRETQFLLKFDSDDAAGLMTPRFLAIRPSLRVGQGLSWVRKNVANIETAYYVYVVDPLQRLIGVVSIRDMLQAQDEELIEQIMVKDVSGLTIYFETARLLLRLG